MKYPKMFRQHIQIEKGRTVLYVELKKALYDILKAALVFWNMLSSKLLRWQGFNANWYDRCVINKMADGKKFTKLWYLDDLKISHVKNPDVVNERHHREARRCVRQRRTTIN